MANLSALSRLAVPLVRCPLDAGRTRRAIRHQSDKFSATICLISVWLKFWAFGNCPEKGECPPGDLAAIIIMKKFCGGGENKQTTPHGNRVGRSSILCLP